MLLDWEVSTISTIGDSDGKMVGELDGIDVDLVLGVGVGDKLENFVGCGCWITAIISVLNYQHMVNGIIHRNGIKMVDG